MVKNRRVLSELRYRSETEFQDEGLDLFGNRGTISKINGGVRQDDKRTMMR